MAYYKIDGIDMPHPSTFNLSYSDVDGEGSGRTAEGFTRRQVLRRKITKIEIAYYFITEQEASQIINAINKDFIDVTYSDILKNSTITKPFYAGDVSTPRYGKDAHGRKMIESLKFNLIEQ